MASTASTKIPPLLEPFLELPPEAALVVLTSVLGASANWLTLRWVYGLLKHAPQNGEDDENTAVVLCSFLRDGAFWREGAGKMVRSLFFFVFGFHGFNISVGENCTCHKRNLGGTAGLT